MLRDDEGELDRRWQEWIARRNWLWRNVILWLGVVWLHLHGDRRGRAGLRLRVLHRRGQRLHGPRTLWIVVLHHASPVPPFRCGRPARAPGRRAGRTRPSWPGRCQRAGVPLGHVRMREDRRTPPSTSDRGRDRHRQDPAPQADGRRSCARAATPSSWSIPGLRHASHLRQPR